ncbi:uncharacterized protein BDW43DRAFT_264463 [Aspergillus alliaceus]|uniref:uncharacterized protein n=1 Tax=Petromyces alliaceus TaxID=209559 RepID=UPI0012A48425|nr:uncharacterized protein BDW43DRAFT_264463 [Aspergillus alliaceus]KAB8237843.1 hypothetical protein BDW43DRAFT_264463 [Aspergillus alliaceus]
MTPKESKPFCAFTIYPRTIRTEIVQLDIETGTHPKFTILSQLYCVVLITHYLLYLSKLIVSS